MSGPFKVGDICIGQNHVIDTEFNGMECEIIIGLGTHKCRHRRTGQSVLDIGYIVIWANGERTLAKPNNLRKKQPPRSAKAIMRAAILKAKHPCEVTA